jgi:hypothetical protein
MLRDGSRRLLALVVTATLAATMVAGVAAASPNRPARTAPAPTRYADAVRGSAPRVHRIAAPANGTHGSHVAPAWSKGARRLSHARAGGTGATGAAAPVATQASGRAAGTAVENFNGTSSRDSEVTNFDARFEPPDQGLCEGNGFVLEAVNSASTIFRRDGAVVRGPFNVNDLFNEGSEEFTSDPRCTYDAATNTWFAIILFINAAGTKGRIDIAVNSSGDPTTFWNQYQIDTTDAGGLGCPCFGDQPRLGIDRNNVYVSTDEFSILGHRFNGAQIYAVAKRDLVRGAPSAHFVHFANLKIAGVRALSVQPALTTGAPAAEYFLVSLDPNGTFDNRIAVWALTGGARVASGGMPTLSSTIITSEPYGLPPRAEQKGASSLIDSGDDRMQQTQYIAGRVWGELTTAVTIPGDPSERAGAAWFAVRPELRNGVISGAAIARQGYVAQANNNVLYPALQADSSGRAAMVFTLTGATRFPSAAFAVLPAGTATFGAVQVAANGTGPYDPRAGRWGDYSWAVLDAHADAVWLATEYIPPKASQTSTGQRNWGTRVVEVSLP